LSMATRRQDPYIYRQGQPVRPGKEKKTKTKPQAAFQQRHEQHQREGLSSESARTERDQVQNHTGVGHPVKDIQLSQSPWCVSKPPRVRLFSKGKRKVENSCPSCKCLFKNNTIYQVERYIYTCYKPLDGFASVLPMIFH